MFLPTSEFSEMRPPRRAAISAMTSMPTPRPASRVTPEAVEKPERKTSIIASWSDSAAASFCEMMPLVTAVLRSLSGVRPRPSSSHCMRKARPFSTISNLMRMWPSGDLPGAWRSAGVSMPCTTALRMSWISTSLTGRR